MRPSSARLRVAATAASLVTLLAGCSTATGSAGTATTAATASAADSVVASGLVHSLALDVDAAPLKKMLQTYVDSGEKEWVKADVTIDGDKFTDVGIRLKGNSSLRGITADTAAQDLPLRIRLDKYVDGQNIDGCSDFTVRSNSTTTSLNEAVSLDLLGQAGLASEKAIATRFSVNGSAEVLRLTVQNLDDTWVEQDFPDAGDDSVLYKADADGNWSWRARTATTRRRSRSRPARATTRR